MNRTNAARGASAALVALLAACSSGTKLAPAVSSTSIGRGAERAIYPVRHTLVVTGAAELDVEQEWLLDVYQILGGQFPAGSSHLTASVGRGAMVVREDLLLRWSADLVPGQYEGPGEYVIDGKAAPKIAEGSGIRSAAYLSIVGSEAGESGLATYNVLVEPCTLTFEKDAVRGHLECPKLGLEGDPSQTIAWTWSWERLEPDEVDPSLTALPSPAPSS